MVNRLICLVALGVGFTAEVQAQQPGEAKVTIGALGGWGRFDGGDLRGSWLGAIDRAREFAGTTRTVDAGPAYNRNGRSLGLELAVTLSPRLRLMASADTETGRFRGTYRTVLSSGTTSSTVATDDEVSAKTFGLALQFLWWKSRSAKTDVSFSAGPTLTLAKGSRLSSSSTGFEFTGASSLGGKGDVAVRRELAPRFRVVARIGYARSRSANLRTGDPDRPTSVRGVLTAYESRVNTTSNNWQTALATNNVFASTVTRNVRDAAADVSGMRARVGIQIDF